MERRHKLKFDERKKDIAFFVFLIIAGAIGVIIYTALTGNRNQVFTDVIQEYPSQTGSNISAEVNLFYIFSFAGGVVCFFYYFFKNRKIEKEICQVAGWKFLLTALCVFAITSLFLYKTIHVVVLAFLIITIVVLFSHAREMLIPAMAFFVVFLYSLLGAYRLYVHLGGTYHLNIELVTTVSVLITILLTLKKNQLIYLRGILISQIFTPFLLLIYLASRYKTAEGDIVNISVTKQAKLLIIILLVAFLANAFVKLIKEYQDAISLQDIMGYGTYVSIISFNQYNGTGALYVGDMHHRFENIIGYSQIFELGQKPYEQYVPVSGMFSVVHGFFFKIFGNGMVSYYNVSTNIYMLFITLIFVYLLRKHLKAEWMLFISAILYLGSIVSYMGIYDRNVLMAPIFLLLTLPRLIDNKNLWLKIWFLTSFFHGLYYPLYGAAICLGFLPLGIWQVYKYVKSEKFKSDIRTVIFWIHWGICFAPVIIGMPLLYGTAKHMLAMAGQTIMADGKPRFGAAYPSTFLSYIDSWEIKTIVYTLLAYMPIIILFWISVSLFFTLAGIRVVNRKIKLEEPIAGFMSLSIGIIMIVSLSYCAVKFEGIYSRADGNIRLAFLIVILLIANYMHNNKNALILFGFACFLLALAADEGYYQIDNDAKLEAYYSVPEDYVHVMNDDPVDQLGDVFISEFNYDMIESSYTTSQSLDKDKSYLGIVGYFGEYYLDKFKGDSVLELYLTVKGYDATQESVDIMKKNGTIVGYSIDPVNNYYLYNYLVTSGDYIWWPAYWMFIPNDIGSPKEEVVASNKVSIPGADHAELAKTAGSWGSSMESLNQIFNEPEINETVIMNEKETYIRFDKSVYGDDADFLYIEFADMLNNYRYVITKSTEDEVEYYDKQNKSLWKYLLKREYNPEMAVTVEWTDDNGETNSITCDMDEGKLLIPLGAGKGWLLDNHNDLKITVTQDGGIVNIPEIREVRMLKLREVN